MHRRRFIKSTSCIALLSGASGCSSLTGNGVQDSDGDGVVDSQDYAPQDPDVQEKSDISGSSQGSDSNTDTGSDRSSNSELIGEAVGNYKAGYDGVEASKDLLSTAINSFEQESYELVITTLSDFESTTRGIATSFSDSAEAAEQLGAGDVREAALAGEAEAKAVGNAGKKIEDAAESAQEENWDDSDEYLGQAQSFLRQAEQEHQNVMDPQQVENKLM